MWIACKLMMAGTAAVLVCAVAIGGFALAASDAGAVKLEGNHPIELARLRRDAGRRPIDDGRAARVSEENVLQRHALGFLCWPGRAGRTADEAPATLPAPRLPGKSRTSGPALACASDGVCDKGRTAPSGSVSV